MFKIVLLLLCIGVTVSAGAKTLIFIPGYYGSELFEKGSSKKLWPDLREILFGSETLAIPVKGVHIPNAKEIQAGAIIEEVSIVPYLLREEAYGSAMGILKKFCEKNKIKFVEFSYDWRQDLIKTVAELDAKISALQKSGEEVLLMSHSMGALLTSYYLRYGTQEPETAKENWAGLKKIKKAVMATAPFRGTMVLFRNMHSGVNFGLNKNLLSPLALSTFPSSYYLLPPQGFDLVFNSNLKDFSLRIDDAKNWQDNQWGLFNKDIDAREETPGAKLEFTKNILNRVKNFYRLLLTPTQEKIPASILYVYGAGFPTIEKGVFNADTKQVYFYNKDLKKYFSNITDKVNYVEGDETLPEYSIEPLPFLKDLKAQMTKYKYRHLDILNQKDVNLEIENFLTAP